MFIALCCCIEPCKYDYKMSIKVYNWRCNLQLWQNAKLLVLFGMKQGLLWATAKEYSKYLTATCARIQNGHVIDQSSLGAWSPNNCWPLLPRIHVQWLRTRCKADLVQNFTIFKMELNDQQASKRLLFVRSFYLQVLSFDLIWPNVSTLSSSRRLKCRKKSSSVYRRFDGKPGSHSKYMSIRLRYAESLLFWRENDLSTSPTTLFGSILHLEHLYYFVFRECLFVINDWLQRNLRWKLPDLKIDVSPTILEFMKFSGTPL